MKYAVFTVSIPEYEPREAAQKVKEAGYDGIEWRVIDQDPTQGGSGFWGGNKATIPFTGFEEKAPEFRKLTEDAGLEMPSIGTYTLCDDPEGADLAMRGAKALGVPQLRIRVPNYNGTDPFMPIWDKARAEYGDIVDLAARHEIKALLELHHRSIVPSASAAKLFLDGLDPAHVGVIHDAGNMVHEGYETHRLSLEQLGPYLAHVHVKNAHWVPVKEADDSTMEWKCDWAPVHSGIIDMRQLFAALHAIGYDGWVGVEDFSTNRPTDDRLRENLAYLKGIESKLATSQA
ncbi:MAG TPA: sugar phosphate isomerase/epimerase family protein [Thermomicrobiales bacterium]|nr:sugar phosphate isomerase/epimerase family protein [Thermomicrobiales bacterium]